MGMENIVAIAAGLGLRALIDSVAGRSYTAAVLVGLWEGIVLNHFLAQSPSSMDPYLALGFRLFVDLLFTESFSRLMIVFLWTGLGMLLADVSLRVSADYRFRRLWRKTRDQLPIPSSHHRSRSLPQRVRFYETTDASTSGTGSTTVISNSSPGVPVRPTTTPLPGRYDQWSEVTPSTATAHSPPASDAASAEPSGHVRDFLAEFGQQRSRTPSELEYISRPVPVEPDTYDLPTPVDAPRSRPLTGSSYPTIPDDIVEPPEDNPAPEQSPATTPRSGPASLGTVADDPLTTPPHLRSGLSLQTSGLAPTVASAPPPSGPARLTLADPSPVSIPVPATAPEPVTIPVAEIPNIPTPDEQNASARHSGPPPPFEEAIKAAPPDDLSVMEEESVISDADKQAIIEKADNIRKLAREQEKERDRIRQEWRRAERERRFFDALRLELELERAQTQVDTLHARAEKRYFAAHNLERSQTEVDVHRLTAPEAISRVKQGLRYAMINDASELRVIVGKGLHSKNNMPVLKKAVIDELKKYHIPAVEDPKNAGVLLIKIPHS